MGRQREGTHRPTATDGEGAHQGLRRRRICELDILAKASEANAGVMSASSRNKDPSAAPPGALKEQRPQRVAGSWAGIQELTSFSTCGISVLKSPTRQTMRIMLCAGVWTVTARPSATAPKAHVARCLAR